MSVALTIRDVPDEVRDELIEAPLVTVDRRIGQAPGLRCDVLVPGGSSER